VRIHSISYLQITNGPNKLMLHHTGLKKSHQGLALKATGPFVSYIENEV